MPPVRPAFSTCSGTPSSSHSAPTKRSSSSEASPRRPCCTWLASSRKTRLRPQAPQRVQQRHAVRSATHPAQQAGPSAKKARVLQRASHRCHRRVKAHRRPPPRLAAPSPARPAFPAARHAAAAQPCAASRVGRRSSTTKVVSPLRRDTAAACSRPPIGHQSRMALPRCPEGLLLIRQKREEGPPSLLKGQRIEKRQQPGRAGTEAHAPPRGQGPPAGSAHPIPAPAHRPRAPFPTARHRPRFGPAGTPAAA